MTSLKFLKGVTHDIVHHAFSGLSYLHPHLGQACRHSQVSSVVLDLSRDPAYPAAFQVSPPLALATQGFKAWYTQLLKRKDLHATDVQSVTLEFSFWPPEQDYPYPHACRCRLVSARGKVYERRQFGITGYWFKGE